jgi:predicted transcriptional regulator
MRGRRTPYEIYWEILVFCRTPRLVTSIVNRCDLNSKLAQEYLGVLTGKGYLAVIREEERTLYQTTENAREYLSLFATLHRTLFDENPGFKLLG